jgi:hypothetical protein
MSIDLAAAERFMYESARLLDRHRMAMLLRDGPAEPVPMRCARTATRTAASAMGSSPMCADLTASHSRRWTRLTSSWRSAHSEPDDHRCSRLARVDRIR